MYNHQNIDSNYINSVNYNETSNIQEEVEGHSMECYYKKYGELFKSPYEEQETQREQRRIEIEEQERKYMENGTYDRNWERLTEEQKQRFIRDMDLTEQSQKY